MAMKLTFNDITVDGTTCRQGGRGGTIIGARSWIEPRAALLPRLTSDPLQQGRDIIPLLADVPNGTLVLSIIGLDYAVATPVAADHVPRAEHFIELLDSLVRAAEAAIPNPMGLTERPGSAAAAGGALR
jgi:hypothetical protein